MSVTFRAEAKQAVNPGAGEEELYSSKTMSSRLGKADMGHKIPINFDPIAKSACARKPPLQCKSRNLLATYPPEDTIMGSSPFTGGREGEWGGQAATFRVPRHPTAGKYTIMRGEGRKSESPTASSVQ